MQNQYHPFLSKALEALQANNFDLAIEALNPHIEANDIDLRTQANNFMGVCYFRKNDFAKAAFYYEKACDLNSGNYTHFFNLALACALSNDLMKAKDAFTQAISFAKIKDPMIISQLRYYFANALIDAKDYKGALDQLNFLWETYMFYHITDKTFLHLRMMLPFEDFLKRALVVLEHIFLEFNGLKWLYMLYKGVDQEGKELIIPIAIKLKGMMNKNKTAIKFTIPLPTEPKSKPLKAIIENVEAGYAICRVQEGTLKNNMNINVKKKNGSLLKGKIVKLESNNVPTNEVYPGGLGAVLFTGFPLESIAIEDEIY